MTPICLAAEKDHRSVIDYLMNLNPDPYIFIITYQKCFICMKNTRFFDFNPIINEEIEFGTINVWGNYHQKISFYTIFHFIETGTYTINAIFMNEHQTKIVEFVSDAQIVFYDFQERYIDAYRYSTLFIWFNLMKS